MVGLAFWPGGLESDWGPYTDGLNPCNATAVANLVSGAAARARRRGGGRSATTPNAAAARQQQGAPS